MTATVTLRAPLSGKVLPLSQVPDPVFAGGMMGQGLAIEPLSSTLLAPCDGVISQLSSTGHAVALRAANGAELLLHIGIDTVKLGGQGFAPRVQAGDRVSCGQPLVDIDIDSVAQRAPSLITVLVVTNSDDMQLGAAASGMVQAGSSALLDISASGTAAEGDSVAGGVSHNGQAVVAHEGGLHARPAALLQHTARRFTSRIEIGFGGKHASARSVVAIMGLGVGEGDTVSVHAFGADAEAALAAMLAAVQTRSEAGHAAAAVPQTTLAARSDGKLGGVCAAPGLAVGTLLLLAEQDRAVPERGAGVEAELTALHGALAQVRRDIEADIALAGQRGARAEGEIFGAHLALLDDPELTLAAERFIVDGRSAAHAYRSAIRVQSEVLLGLGNALLAERVADLKDLERRVLDVLLGSDNSAPQLPAQAIVVADDLTPSQLTRLPRAQVAGLVLARGGATNHVAILARALGIPALVACGPAALQLPAGAEAVLDAGEGWLDAQPDAANLALARQQIAGHEARRQALREQSAGRALTRDGVHIEVAANVVNAAETRDAVLHGADGVGLLRTEFLFTERTDAPSSEEQRAACQAVLDALEDRPAIIRTLDAGGDKDVPYLPLPAEDNPALGLRGIRTSLAVPEVLDAQLTALLQLKPLSRLRILLPMVTDVADLLLVRQRIEVLAAQLGLSERPQLGVMIEVPSAALLAAQLAEHADFLSIGTNDLTQYTLAMDRCHPALAARQDALHPAVLRLIALTVHGARQHGRWVGVCGALASDPLATAALVGLGVTELSVSPALVPEIKDRVRQLDAAACQELALTLQAQRSAAEVRALLTAAANVAAH
ncbi:phosphoenolpyruvate--protein phosphotransferase [Vogesella sp. LIG4]|uniref:phosphoenolpyruvate--protein phosphotransferase n=1 Tax=Vogesella sp. LIG4 TaxID=1192162 RepID=UPI00081FD688|nr:phosphoenolpyruvate--protein phosphotransferase [Vogesella sp. LIG4]SCK13662.1 Phosphocarrier protein HPr /phosphoenolpyruvate--protein phosphotransferase /PTS system IIA component, Glc family [Vogesella sp. LIG4]